MEIPELSEQEALDLQDYYDGQLRHMEQEATPTDEQIESLLTGLDSIAFEYDRYTYGLPVNGKTHSKLIQCVRDWLSTL